MNNLSLIIIIASLGFGLIALGCGCLIIYNGLNPYWTILSGFGGGFGIANGMDELWQQINRGDE